jgi:hypothetical protein
MFFLLRNVIQNATRWAGKVCQEVQRPSCSAKFWSCIPHTIDDPIVEEPIEFLAISLIKLDPNRRTEKNLLVRSLNGATNQQRHRTSFSGSSAGRAKSRATNIAY